jgi:hypothetical protein
MTITASQVEICSTYQNTASGNFKRTVTIKQIIVTPAGRFKFVYDELWTNLLTKEETKNVGMKSHGAVKGNYEMFESIV